MRLDWSCSHQKSGRINTLALTAVVSSRLGMDKETADLWYVEFEGAFECGNDLVDLRHGKVIR